MTLSRPRHGPARPGHPNPHDAAMGGPDDPPIKSGEGHDVKGESQSLSALV